MQQGSVFYRLIHLASPKAWLGISVLSLLMAGGSVWVLVSRGVQNPKDGLYTIYDPVTRFVNDTIRLTFKSDKNQTAVFVAPLGILNQKARFNPLESYVDFQPVLEDVAPKPQAPVHLLDQEWKPIFSDQFGHKEL
jgi:hypothetical protein